MTAEVRRAYIDNIHGQLHYRISRPAGTPTRPTLLCLHQTPKSGWDYEPIMPLLATDRVVLAPDTPGYGGSDAPDEMPDIEDFGAAMLRFLDDLVAAGAIPAGPVDVMGYHTGSVTATHLGVSAAERVRRVILLGLAAYDEEARAKKLANLGVFPVPRPDAGHVGDLWRLMETMHDARIDLGWKHQSLAEHLRPGDRLPWGFRAVYRYDFLGALAALDKRALVLCPEDDLWAVTQQAVKVMKHAELAFFPGAAHGFLKLDAPVVAARIHEFLEAA